MVEYNFTKQLVLLLRKAFLPVLPSVVCPPGTFSPPKSLQCSSCPIGTYSMTYGVTFCTPCKDDMITQVPGASSMSECVTERTEQGTASPAAGAGQGGDRVAPNRGQALQWALEKLPHIFWHNSTHLRGPFGDRLLLSRPSLSLKRSKLPCCSTHQPLSKLMALSPPWCPQLALSSAASLLGIT